MSEEFKSGETVPTSGIYTVRHSEHRLPHEVTLLAGQKFPACAKCGNGVSFRILRPVVGLDDRREQILLYSIPELPDEEGTKASGETGARQQRRPRAKAHRRGKQ